MPIGIKHIFLACLFSFICFLPGRGIGQSNIPTQEIVFLRPTGQQIKGFEVMEPWPDSDTIETIRSQYLDSFIYESLQLFRFVQNFRMNTGVSDHAEPLYVAFTHRQGGYPVIGFHLKENGVITDKSNEAYIDFHEDNMNQKFNKVGTPAQILPHEIGHVFLKFLCEKGKEIEFGNSDVHYFNVITNYWTAFNEGFAEHFEPVSWKWETNPEIKSGIDNHLEELEHSYKYKINGLHNDFFLPFRMGLYRASTIAWLQQLEDYNRLKLAESAKVRFKNRPGPGINKDNSILYRNSGVKYSDNLRNKEQLSSTEGVISSFFYHLMQSDLKNIYMPPLDYKVFQNDSSLIIENPQSHISPLHNQYLKIFKVLAAHIKQFEYKSSHLTDFVEGYCKEFPDEASTINHIYHNVTNTQYTSDIGPEIWVMNESFPHRFLKVIQFGLTLPYYSFNLNTAEKEDLLTLRINREDAIKLLNFRNSNNYFKNLGDVTKTDISEESKKILFASAFDESKASEANLDNLNLSKVLVTQIIHVFGIFFLWFLLSSVVIYILRKRQEFSLGLNARYFLGKIVTALTLLLAALFSVILTLNFPIWLLILGAGLLLLMIQIGRHYKNPNLRMDRIITTTLYTIIILYSAV